jgi:hypothetical protein
MGFMLVLTLAALALRHIYTDPRYLSGTSGGQSSKSEARNPKEIRRPKPEEGQFSG